MSAGKGGLPIIVSAAPKAVNLLVILQGLQAPSGLMLDWQLVEQSPARLSTLPMPAAGPVARHGEVGHQAEPGRAYCKPALTEWPQHPVRDASASCGGCR